MKNSTPLLKTLLVAAAAMSFCATPVWADDDDENTITLSDGGVDLSTVTAGASVTSGAIYEGYVIKVSSSILDADTWGADGYKGAWIGWSSSPVLGTWTVGSADAKATIEGSGFLGIALKNGNGSYDTTVDLTYVDVSNFTGQLSVVNVWADNVTVKLSGDQWAGVEYIFGSVTAEWGGVSGTNNGNWNGDNASGGSGLFTRGTSAADTDSLKERDILALQGDTTLAGITGTSLDYHTSNNNYYASDDSITVTTAGTTLTIAGTGEYAFYGTVGASGTEVSLVMDSKNGYVAGSGKQTFGGTNYLQNVTVTAGTLALGGTTDISGTASVGTGATLDLSGTITLGSAISNSGTITIADETCFVLDNLTQTYDPDRGYGYCQLIEGSGGTLSYTEGSISFSFDGGTIDWSIYVDQGTGNVYAYGTVGELTWAGTESSNTWNTTDANWVVEGSADKTTFIEGDSATFGADGYKTVNITESLKVGSISVEDDYTFTTNQADGVIVDAGNALTISKGKTLTIDSGVTLYIDFEESDFNVDGKIAGTGTIEIDLTGGNSDAYASTINLGTDNEFAGTVYIHSGDFTLNGSNIGNGTYELAGSVNMQVNANTSITVANNFIIDGTTSLHCNTQGGASSLTIIGSVTGEGTLTLAAGSGNALTISGDVDLGGLTFSTAATITLNTYTDETTGGVTTGTSSKIGTVTFSSAGTLVISDGITLTVGTLTDTATNATINIGDGSTLNVTGSMGFGTGSASSTATKITGQGANNSTVIANELDVGTNNGVSVQVTDVTLVVGSIVNGSNTSGNGLNFYLYLADSTLGFTGDTTIQTHSGGSTSRIVLGTKSSGSFDTTGGSTTVTISTTKYDTTAGAFSDSDGVNVTISEQIEGTDATLIVDGLGKLTLSGTATLGALTLSSGALEISGTTTAGGLTVSAGTLSVSEGGSLNLSGTVSLATSIENSGTITIADGTSFIIDGIEMSTKGNDGANYYVIIDGSSGTGSVSFSGSISDFTLSSGGGLDGWSVYVEDGYLVIHNGEPPQELTWAGTSDGNVWNANQENTIWKNTDGDSVAFSTDSNVTFDDTAENKSVVLGDNIDAGTITVTGTGYELSGNYTLTATEFTLADEDSGEHTFTIAEDTTVEVGKFTENVGQMNLVVNGDLKVDGDMHVDASADEVISGSGTFYVRDFTYDAAQGSSLTISVADASFTTLYEQPSSGSDDSNGDYRRLIIGSEGGAIPDGKDYSTEVWVSDGLTLAGKSELRVNENSYLYTTYLTDSSDYDTLISGEGYLEAAYVTFGGKGEVTISIATFDVGDITFSNEGKLTISSDCFWAYTAVFSNSGDITITSGANVFIGETTSTVNHTITVDEGATFTVGSLDRTQNQLNLVVNGTMNVVKDITFGEYTDGSSGLLSFGDSTDDSKTSYAQTLSGTGTVNAYGLETNLSSGSLTISVANLNIGEGGITEYGNNGIHIAGTTIGLYNTTDLTLSVPLTIDSAGATFNTESGEKLTLSGAITGNGMVTKDGEGDLILAGTGSILTSGLTVLDGTLSVAAGVSLTIGGTVDLSSAIQNSGSITIADSTSFVMDNLSAIYDAENKRLYYEVVTGSGDGASVTLNSNTSFTLGDGSLDGWTAYADDNGNLYVYSEEITSLTWAGTTETSINWTTDTSIMDWTPDGGTTKTYFFEGANVIFDTIGDSGISSEVKIAESVTAGTITVNDSYSFTTEVSDGVVVKTSGLEFGDGGKLTIGDDVTVQITETLDSFSANGTIVGTGTLQLELSSSGYSATVNLGTENEFAGTVYITAGNFTLNGSDIGNGTFRLADGVNMQVNSSGTEVGNNFIFEGTSEVHINENDSLTINGSITGVAGDDGAMGGTLDRQGAGDLTIAGNVDIGTFIIDTSGNVSVSSSTTFSGESVTIGTLDVTYADSVVFAGGSESNLSIGTLTFEAAGTIEFKNGGTVGTISYDKQSSSGIIRVSGGTLEVGTITNTYTDVQSGNETLTEIEVGEGATLHAKTITIAPGNAGSVYSTISGIMEGGAGTVIVDNFIVGNTETDSGGASIEVSDVTLVVGALSFGNGENSNFNLYLKNATLGFTEDVTISATTANGSNSRFVLGGFASGNSTDTGSGTTTTINTSKYDVETGAFTSTGVTVTISQIISGQGELVVDGVGKLILSAENTYSGGTTIKEGATVVVKNESALGSGDVSVEGNATLQVDTHVTTSGDVTFSEYASLVVSQSVFDGVEVTEDPLTAEAVAVITANTITFGDTTLSTSDYLDEELVSKYITVESGDYRVTGWYYCEDNGTLYAIIIPEPSMFGLFFGLGALGLVATHRRRRRQYREAA